MRARSGENQNFCTQSFLVLQDLMGARALSGGLEGGIEEEGPQRSGPPEGASATAAKRMVQAVQQFVAMLQIQQVTGNRRPEIT